MTNLGDLLPEVAQDDGFQPASESANEIIQKALNETSVQWPQPESLESDLVELPGGITLDDGTLVKHARVRELTGADEEAIARSSVALNPFHFVNTLLECGVATIGEQPAKKTKTLLKQLLVGDRDALIMGIRKITYGEGIEINGWICPGCGTESDLTIPCSDIPVRELDPPGQPDFEVELRKGRIATVTLANGADQLAVFENQKLNSKERDTLLLARTLVSIKEADGQVNGVAGYQHATAIHMNMVDRNKILKQLVERQPGPQFGDVKFTHDTCNEEVTVAVGIGDMFPDL